MAENPQVDKVYVVNNKAVPVVLSGTSTTGVIAPITETNPIPVTIGDSVHVDSFSRLRVSSPQGLFDGQFTYNLLPLQFEAVTANGVGGTSATRVVLNWRELR